MPEKPETTYEVATLEEAKAGLPAFLNLELVRQDPRVQELASKLAAVKTEAEAIRVENDEDYKKAGDFLAGVKKLLKVAEEARKAITSPHDRYCKAVNKFFKELLEPAEAALKPVDGAMVAHYRRKEAERKEAERKAAEEAERRRKEEEARAAATGQAILPEIAPPEPATPAPTKTVTGEKATSTVRDNWTGQVVDESLVPREYLSPDMAKIKKAIALGVREIPGVYIYNDLRVASRAAA